MDWRIDKNALLRRVIMVAVYYIALVAIYLLVISPLYSYSLLTTNINYEKMVLGIVQLVGLIIIFPCDMKRPSSYLLSILFLVSYVPLNAYYWLNDQASAYIILVTIAYVIMEGMARFDIARFSIKISRSSAKFILLCLFGIYVVSSLFLVYRNGGIKLSGIMSDLYGVRSENDISGVWGYLVNWCAKSFMPFFFIYFAMKKDYALVMLTCMLQALLFLSFGFKAFIMAVVLLIGVSILMQKKEWFFILICGALALGVIGGIVLENFMTNNTLMKLVGYRTLMIPAQGQYEYFTFFTQHDHLYFSEGFIGRLLGIEYPYDKAIGFIVNVFIYGPSKISNGNTGAIAYGFADAGVIGVLLVALNIGIIMILVDVMTKELPVFIPVSAMAYQYMVLNDTGLLISLNTGGIVITILLLLLYNSDYSPEGEKRMLPAVLLNRRRASAGKE